MQVVLVFLVARVVVQLVAVETVLPQLAMEMVVVARQLQTQQTTQAALVPKVLLLWSGKYESIDFPKRNCFEPKYQRGSWGKTLRHC
jgi:hypothetical protein